MTKYQTAILRSGRSLPCRFSILRQLRGRPAPSSVQERRRLTSSRIFLHERHRQTTMLLVNQSYTHPPSGASRDIIQTGQLFSLPIVPYENGLMRAFTVHGPLARRFHAGRFCIAIIPRHYTRRVPLPLLSGISSYFILLSAGVMGRSTRHGLPTATTLSGISRVTTLPAPITTLSPMVTPGMTCVPAPIHTLLPTLMG